MVDYSVIISKGFALGLTTGGFCSLYCLPTIAPVMLGSKKQGIRKALFALLQFLAGRLFAYTLFGLAAGFFGQAVNDNIYFSSLIIPLIYIVLGLMMLVYGVTGAFPHKGACSYISRHTEHPFFLFGLGFLVGINVCPPFILAVSTAVDIGGAINGLIFFLSFFVATSIFLLPLILTGIGSRIELLKRIAKLVSVGVGIMYIIQASMRLYVLF